MHLFSIQQVQTLNFRFDSIYISKYFQSFRIHRKRIYFKMKTDYPQPDSYYLNFLLKQWKYYIRIILIFILCKSYLEEDIIRQLEKEVKKVSNIYFCTLNIFQLYLLIINCLCISEGFLFSFIRFTFYRRICYFFLQNQHLRIK